VLSSWYFKVSLSAGDCASEPEVGFMFLLFILLLHVSEAGVGSLRHASHVVR
jgi:hypothetical protein